MCKWQLLKKILNIGKTSEEPRPYMDEERCPRCNQPAIIVKAKKPKIRGYGTLTRTTTHYKCVNNLCLQKKFRVDSLDVNPGDYMLEY